MGDVQKNQDSVHFEYIEYTERGKCIPNLSVSQLSQMATVCEGLVLLPQLALYVTAQLGTLDRGVKSEVIYSQHFIEVPST